MSSWSRLEHILPQKGQLSDNCPLLKWVPQITPEKGGPGKVVVIDESFITRRKRNRRGFMGRTTTGHTTVVFAALELLVQPDGSHKETGRAVLRVVPNKTTATLAKLIEKFIAAGSTVYSDGAAMYTWLDKHPEQFRHLTVIHAKGEFSRRSPSGLKQWGNFKKALVFFFFSSPKTELQVKSSVVAQVVL